jgi:acetoin utilization protein AcuC
VLHELAHDAAGGRWVATGGGGYQWASVVPRAWTTYFAEMAGTEIPDALPGSWIERASALAGGPVPTSLSEDAV